MRNTLFFTALSLLTLSALGEDNVQLFWTVRNYGGQSLQVDYSIPSTRFFSLPTWDAEGETIPLPIEKAVAIARNASQGITLENGLFVKRSRMIHKVSLENKNNRWWYVIELKQPKGFEQKPNDIVIVLMDGTTVEGIRKQNN